MDWSQNTQSIPRRVTSSPWSGYEHVRGYGVLSLPFSSGHNLGLRVFPESDFAPYVSVWHQTPDGNWSIYNDGPSLNVTCPRWWGPALSNAALASIDVSWTDRDALRVEMESPRLTWTMKLLTPPALEAMNAVSARLPLWTWRFRVLRRLREWGAERAGMGSLQFRFTTPSGHDTTIMPEQVAFIRSSDASWNGQPLGDPVRLDETPTIAGVPLPRGPTFMIGQAHARITNEEEYRRTREAARAHDRSTQATMRAGG